MRPILLPFVLLALPGCAERYYCGPGTHVEGEWCVLDKQGRGGDTANDTADTGGDTGTDTGADTSTDTGEDTAVDTGDPPEPARLVINELMASNSEKATDELGEYDDWVEIYNAGDRPMPLDELALTDVRDDAAPYTFPAGITLPGKSWVVVWCDGQPEQGAYHASFTLQSAGDQVYLLRDPAGVNEVVDAVDYTDFPREQSAIRMPDGSDTWTYSDNVTPGAANTE